MTTAEKIHLCLNCLDSGATPYPVGHEKGTQRDPEREELDLCETCSTALEAGDFATLAERQADQRNVVRVDRS